jgi:glc operon protein GlcG
MNITHTQANEIIQVVVSEFIKRKKTGIVAVADSHGELISFLRMDGSKLTSISIVTNKAWTAARAQKRTSEIGKTIKDPEKGFDVSYYGDPRITGFGGGVPVIKDGKVIGSVAVSGLSQEEDEELAEIGIQKVM